MATRKRAQRVTISSRVEGYGIAIPEKGGSVNLQLDGSIISFETWLGVETARQLGQRLVLAADEAERRAGKR